MEPSLVGGVLRLDLLAADLRYGVVGRDRGLAHADRDQRDLARIAGHVAGRVDALHARAASHGVDPDLPLALELEAPLRDRAEVRVEAEQRDERGAVDAEELVRVDPLDRHRLDVAVAVDLPDL